RRWPAPRGPARRDACRTWDAARRSPPRWRSQFSTRRGRRGAPRDTSAGAGLVEVHDDLVGGRIALAREDESAGDFVILEREVDVHVDLAFDEPAAAGGAYAALARIRQLDAVAQPGVQDIVLALGEQVRLARSVLDHRD